MEYAGLRWYKCDFHLHTMCSQCYKDKGNTPEQWVDAVKAAGLQCIAITDHNDYRGIGEIKKICEKEGIIAFPGVELSCSDCKVHMLVLFDCKCDETDVQEFLNSVGVYKESYGNSGQTCDGKLADVCIKAKQKGALVIAAHIDEFSGINDLSHDNLINILDRKCIDAVQVVNSDIWDKIKKDADYQSASEELSKKYGKEISIEVTKKWHKAYKMALKTEIPLLMFSDNPSAEGESSHGLWGIGSVFTWMKMNQEPNLESVRQTLISSDMRVRTVKECIKKPDNVPELWINSIKVSNTTLNKNDFEICFNPQLNSIIGGRGSGKSSIIRMIAGALQAFDADNLDKIKGEQEDFYKIPGKDKRGVFTRDSKIEIILERAEDTYKLEISSIKKMSEQTRVLYKLIGDEWVIVEDKNYLDFFDAQVYTQKQIYELALDSTSLLNIIDEDISGLSKKVAEKEALLSQVISKWTEVWNLEKKIEEEGRIQTEIKDLEEQISKFEKSGISEALQAKQVYSSQKQLIENYLRNRKEQAVALSEEITSSFSSIAVETFDNPEIDLLIRQDLDLFKKRGEELAKILSMINADIDNLSERILTSEWKKSADKAEEKYTEACVELEKQGLDSSKLDDLLAKKEAKKTELEKIGIARNQVASVKKDLEEYYAQYESIMVAISKLRSEFIDGVIGQGSNVKFEIKRNRSRNSFVQTLKTLINKDIGTIDENINELADMFFENNGKELFRKRIQEIREGIDKSSYSSKLRTAICEATPETYARMISFLPEDDLKVSYKPENSSKYIPLSNASAGQKTTAILTFLLAYGELPLLLDQPEDDLDNKLVYDLIVSRLKTAKSKRQIIVVTHNANIPVNADAEYIVSMNSETDEISTKFEGTMDDENIRKEICDVMEGTKFAFEMRAKKYHFKIVE